MAYEDYWIKRADDRMEEIQKGSDDTIHEIHKAYDAAVKELNRDIDRMFFRFAGRNGLTPEEAGRLLKERLSQKDAADIRRRIAWIEDEEIKKQLLMELDATIYRARITRLEALKEDIYIQMARMADVEIKRSTARYFDIIQEEYLHNVFDCQKYLGFAYSFSRIPEGVIREILKDDWSGKHYSRRIWENALANGGRIEDTVKGLLLKGTLTGTNSRKLAKELGKLANAGKYACERLIRTEGTYFTAMADLEAAKARGTKKLRFVATLDQRTSLQCREADGKLIDIEDARPGKNIPPLHPFCRSVIIDVIEGLVHKVRTARNPKTGKNYKIPVDMTYQEWNRKLVETGKLLLPEIRHEGMVRSLEDFGKTLEQNDDGSNLFRMLRMSKDNADYVEDRSLGGAYAYVPEADEFRYNPEHEYFGQYDMNFVYAHELGHRLDCTWTHSWESKEFLSAIESTRKSLYNNKEVVLKWLDGKYSDDAGFSDIVSALSYNRIKGRLGHGEEYWQKDEKNVPMEIFANMVYIKTMKSQAFSEIDGFLKGLFKAMEEMI